jgi:membrane-associated phospholipid phosphatase
MSIGRVCRLLKECCLIPRLEPGLSAADSLCHVLRHRALPPLVAAAACALAAVLVWLTAYHLSPFEAIDQRTFDGFLGLFRPATAGWAEQFSHLADPGPFALFAVTLVAVALLRRRPRTAIAVTVILAGSNLSTQILKPALAKPELFPGSDMASWPSGHATAAMALVLCLQLVVPRRLRPAAAAFGGLFALAIVYSILILGHHEPSDVLGGFLMAGAWTGLGVAALRTLEPEHDPALRTAATLLPAGVVASVLAVAATALALSHWQETLDYATVHTTFIAGAAVITLGALGMSTAAALALTRD